MKAFGKWLLLVVVLAALIVGSVEYFFYRSVSQNDLPLWQPVFGEEALSPTEYHWFVPVAGRHLGRSFSMDKKAPAAFPATLTSQPKLKVPAAARSRLTLTKTDGSEVFSGTAEEYSHFSFTEDGDYTGRLELCSQQDLRQSDAVPTGSYAYDFSFRLHCSPTLTVSTDTAVQGSVVGVRLSGVLGTIPPVIQCDLARDAVFAPVDGDWVCYLPVDYNQPGGDYPIKVTVGGHTAESSVKVRGRGRREQDSYTANGTAAIPYIGKFPKKLEEVLTIADPDIYWSGPFTQPVSGRVVRDYAVLEYIDRIDAATLAIAPELAAINETIAPRRSVNVTMAVSPGRKVVAPAAGRVVFAGNSGEGGRTVVIEHGCALKSIIYLLGKLNVSEGDSVAQGDVIGKTQGHVICEMRLYDVPISPWEVWRGHGALFQQ